MKNLLGALFALVCVVPLAGCAAFATSQESAGDLVVALPSDVSSLDPVAGNAGSDHVVLYSIYDTLVDFDPDTMEPRPGLAKSWDYPDPHTLRLQLRHGVEFQDGTPLDAEAVKVNLDRARAKDSNLASELVSIDSVEAVGRYTVELSLTDPDSSLPLILSDRAGMMASPAVLRDDPKSLATEPVGTGPWKFEEWNRGSAVELTRFEGYWNQDAVVAPRLTYRVLTDPKTRVDALITNQIDFAYQVGPGDAESLALNESVKVRSDPSIRVRMVYLDLSTDQFKDERVREAANLAIDRDQLAEAGYFGYARPASSYLPGSHWASIEDEKPYPYDPDRARSLLKEAGKEGMKISILMPNDANTVRIGEILRYSLKSVGFDVEMKPRELVQSTTEYFDEHRDPALLSAWTGRPDPAQTYRQLLFTDAYYNAGGVTTPGLEEGVTRSNTQTEESKRAVGLKDSARAGKRFFTMIPLVFEDTIVAYSDDVHGYQPNLLGKPKFTGITKGDR